MKKILTLLVFFGLGLGITSAYDYCFEFGGNDEVCFSVDKAGSSTFRFDGDVRGDGIAICHVETPDDVLHLIEGCNDTFRYTGRGLDQITLYVRYDNSYETRYLYYDYDDGTFANGGSSNYPTTPSYSDDIMKVKLTNSDDSPRTNQAIDISIELFDEDDDRLYDVDTTVKFRIEEWRNGGWYAASTNDYNLQYSSYRFRDGFVRFDNFVSFDSIGNYRLKVDADGLIVYTYFDVDSNGSHSNNYYGSDDVEDIGIDSSNNSPRVHQQIHVEFQLLDNYGDSIDERETLFFSVQERSSSSSSRRSASSSLYDLSRSSYRFSTTDDGEVYLSNFLSFDEEGEYRLKVTNNAGLTRYEYFDVGDGYGYSYGDDVDRIGVTSSDTSPRILQQVDLDIELLDDNGYLLDVGETVSFTVQKRASSSSARINASFSDYHLSRSRYRFTTSDDGDVSFDDFLYFRTEGDYRLVVRSNDVVAYEYFDVRGSSSPSYRSEADDFRVDVSNTTALLNRGIDIEVTVLDRYNEVVDLYSDTIYFTVEKSDSRNRWTRASSRDFTLARTSYRFSSRDDGLKTFDDLIEFDQIGRYRLVVSDNDGISTMVYFDTRSSNGSYGGSSDEDFSYNQLVRVRRVYLQRESFIGTLENRYSSLRYDTQWQRMQRDLFVNMSKVVNNESSIWNSYDEFYADLLLFVSLTMNLR